MVNDIEARTPNAIMKAIRGEWSARKQISAAKMTLYDRYRLSEVSTNDFFGLMPA